MPEGLKTSGEDLQTACKALLDHYVGMIDSGDCGFWDPEKEEVVIAVRAALAAQATKGGDRHTDRSVPCPTCGFHIREAKPVAFVFESDEPDEPDEPPTAPALASDGRAGEPVGRAAFARWSSAPPELQDTLWSNMSEDVRAFWRRQEDDQAVAAILATPDAEMAAQLSPEREAELRAEVAVAASIARSQTKSVENLIRDALADCSTVDYYSISETGVDNLAMLAAKAVAEAPAAPVGDLAGLSERASQDTQAALSALARFADEICSSGGFMHLHDELHDLGESAREHDPDVGIFANHGYADACEALAYLVETVGPNGITLAKTIDAALLPAAHRETVTKAQIKQAIVHALKYRPSIEYQGGPEDAAADAVLAILTAPRAEGETQDGWQPIEQKPPEADWIVYLPDGAEDGLGWALDADERLAALLWWSKVAPNRSDVTHFRLPLDGPASPDAVQTNGGKR